MNKNKSEPAAPAPSSRVHASLQNKAEAADSKGKRMLACQQSGEAGEGWAEDRRDWEAPRGSVQGCPPQVQVAKPCPHTSYIKPGPTCEMTASH